VADETAPPPERGLRVLLADESVAALERLRDVLEQLGHEPTGYAVSVPEAARRIVEDDPDIAFVMVHNDDDHALALIEEAVESASGPVVAHIRDADVDFVARAAERGIAAYIDSASPHAVQGAIEVALRRHREQAGLEEKVAQLETALERRVVIERAKGVLMERYAIDDTAAFQMLRDHARAGRRRVVDVAAAVLGGQDLAPDD
jgi:AmiR/NasT family two-component response regulator